MAKGKAGKPDSSKKPGSEGLPYKNAASVVGGPVQNDIEGSGLGADYDVKGDKSLTPTPSK